MGGPRRGAAARGIAAAAGCSCSARPWCRSAVRKSPASHFFEGCSKAASADMWSPLPPRADARHGSRRARWRAASGRFAAHRGPESCGSPAKRAAVRSCWSSWPATRASTGWSRDGRPRFAEMFDTRLGRALAGCAPLPRDAGDLRPADGAGAHLRGVRHRRARGSLSWRCSAPPTSFAAAARRNGSRRITIGSAKCWPRRSPADDGRRHPPPSWCRRSSRGEATTVRRCSSTTAAPEIPRTRRFRPVLPPRKPALRLPSTGPHSSTGRRWR